MLKAKIQTSRKKENKKLPPKEKEEANPETNQKIKPEDEGPVADISHIYNHKLLDEYSKYFNDEELVTDLNAKHEKERIMIALYILKKYKFVRDEKDIPFREIEIYSHDDPYKDFLLRAFKDFENGASSHPGCMVFCVKANNNKIKGEFYIMVTSIEIDGKLIEGRRQVYAALGENCKMISPSKEEALTYDFETKDNIFTSPRRELNFASCTNMDDLNGSSKNIMAPRSYSLHVNLFCDERKMLYVYQCMRNNEGEAYIAENFKIKPQKLSAWLRKFFKTPETKDPDYFLRQDYQWNNFEEYLKAFKYFTQFT